MLVTSSYMIYTPNNVSLYKYLDIFVVIILVYKTLLLIIFLVIVVIQYAIRIISRIKNLYHKSISKVLINWIIQMCVPYVSEYIWAYGLKWGFKWNYWATTIFAQYKDLDKIIGQLAYYYFSPIERPGTRFFFFS